MFLLKFLAHSGVCSRRKAIDLVKNGNVSINGKRVTDVAYDVKDRDTVEYLGNIVKPKRSVYILLNKPKGYITTCSDEKSRSTVLDLVTGVTKERVYPVGRLDRATTGLILLTNDGEFANKLSHPRSKVTKRYRIQLDKGFTKDDMEKLVRGIYLFDGKAKVDSIGYSSWQDKKDVTLELHSGRNRVVRRMFEALGYKVKRLDRNNYAGLKKSNLPLGRSRLLTYDELRMLKSL